MTTSQTSRFTPGPWTALRKVSPEAGEEWQRDICAIADEGGWPTIVEGAYFVSARDDENTANLRLICAAPDLYEALVGMLRSWDEMLLPEEHQENEDRARAAIAKAVGTNV